jgi:phage shock protein A
MNANEIHDVMENAAKSNDPAVRQKADAWKDWAKASNALDAAEAKLAAALHEGHSVCGVPQQLGELQAAEAEAARVIAPAKAEIARLQNVIAEAEQSVENAKHEVAAAKQSYESLIDSLREAVNVAKDEESRAYSATKIQQ